MMDDEDKLLLQQECEKYGLPVSLEVLLRHNGAQKHTNELLIKLWHEYHEALEALLHVAEPDSTEGSPFMVALRLCQDNKRAYWLTKDRLERES